MLRCCYGTDEQISIIVFVKFWKFLPKVHRARLGLKRHPKTEPLSLIMCIRKVKANCKSRRSMFMNNGIANSTPHFKIPNRKIWFSCLKTESVSLHSFSPVVINHRMAGNSAQCWAPLCLSEATRFRLEPSDITAVYSSEKYSSFT